MQEFEHDSRHPWTTECWRHLRREGQEVSLQQRSCWVKGQVTIQNLQYQEGKFVAPMATISSDFVNTFVF